MMKIQLKDKTVKEYGGAMSVYDIAFDISEGLARMATAGEINGEVVDLRTVVDTDCQLNILTANDEQGLAALRHTTAHVLAQAVKNLYPDTKIAIGPAIENGFYYDFECAPFAQEDLPVIEKEMKKIIKAGAKIERFELSRAEAIALMEKADEPYKVELINDLPEDAVISFYDQGGFVDLCAGPHMMSVKNIKAFKLISSSGAYWKGSEKNKMLTRVYGTAFPKKDELNAHLEHLEEIKKRDHNKLGREMELFTTVDVIGQGLPLIMPNGTIIMQELQRWVEDLEASRGYVRTKTPLMAKKDLYEISNHWEHYKEGMFVLGDEEVEGEEVFALRPMTCPFQYYVYKQSQKSYRELPIRYGETSTLFRKEDSGEMHGLTRVRQFTISEGHLIVTPEQMEEEFKACVTLSKDILHTLGLTDDVSYRLSLSDPENMSKYLGDRQSWDEVENMMRKILDDIGLDYTESEGESAFYGPKLDIQAKNVYGKEDTMITVQLDMFLAELFDMTFIDKDGEKKRPFIIHRTSLGCYERTLAWLIEKYAGLFPTWLCPEQVKVLPLSEKYHEYANKVANELKGNGVRCSVDERGEKLGYKIRDARMKKVPYLVVVGADEEEKGLVSVRSRYLGDEGQKSLDTFIDEICKEIRTKEIKEIQVQPEEQKK